MRKVLIAIDYNPTSEKVVTDGYKLAQSLNAEVCLIHVITNLQYYGAQYPVFMGFESMNLTYDPKIHDQMKKIAEDYVATVASHIGDPQLKTHVAEGDTAKEILDYAKQWGADFIVMGTHSHSAFEKLLIGTVANAVLEKTTIPVHMVPVNPEKV
ncbi:universal stress protein [Galbibacter sp.]|uniref:universal stress protein n=1 Tax=Galbibacter sp. TaxID=2918471 RepID=UPI002C2C149D|nr:universal stress protein [Galbibacter sp.]HLV62425.1 universal stress protein [Galbibacter sp.]